MQSISVLSLSSDSLTFPSSQTSGCDSGSRLTRCHPPAPNPIYKTVPWDLPEAPRGVPDQCPGPVPFTWQERHRLALQLWSKCWRERSTRRAQNPWAPSPLWAYRCWTLVWPRASFLKEPLKPKHQDLSSCWQASTCKKQKKTPRDGGGSHTGRSISIPLTGLALQAGQPQPRCVTWDQLKSTHIVQQTARLRAWNLPLMEMHGELCGVSKSLQEMNLGHDFFFF